MTSHTSFDFWFYLYFIGKPFKCASEDIPLQKISIAFSQTHLLYSKKKLLKNNEERYLDQVNLFKKAYWTLQTKKQYAINNIQYWKCACTQGERGERGYFIVCRCVQGGGSKFMAFIAYILYGWPLSSVQLLAIITNR